MPWTNNASNLVLIQQTVAKCFKDKLHYYISRLKISDDIRLFIQILFNLIYPPPPDCGQHIFSAVKSQHGQVLRSHKTFKRK